MLQIMVILGIFEKKREVLYILGPDVGKIRPREKGLAPWETWETRINSLKLPGSAKFSKAMSRSC